MLLYARRLLQRQPLRLTLTITAVALCAVMMQFLLATYRGVAVGSVDYVRKNECDLWVLQKNTTNLLRGTSFLSTRLRDSITETPDVRSASQVLLLLLNLRSRTEESTIFLAGYEPAGVGGGPPEVVEGRHLRREDEIVLDRAYALKMGIRLGDTVHINDMPLAVRGLSAGTNAFVIQYGFVTLDCARRISGVADLISLFLIDLDGGANVGDVEERLERQVTGIEAFQHETFVENNLREMESGFLPLLYAVAGIGVVVMTVVLSLLLSITILERRRDFAIMKTLGAPRGYLPASVALQALMIAGLGLAVEFLLYPGLVAVVEYLSPAVSTSTTLPHILAVAAVCLFVSQFSALLAMRRLRTIYALEVFQ